MSQWDQEGDGVLCMALELLDSGMGFLLAPGLLLWGIRWKEGAGLG